MSWVELITGEMLGDGHIRKLESGSCMYAHFSKHRPYLTWLANELELQGFSTKLTSQLHERRGRQHDVYRLRTRIDPRLEAIHREWYTADAKAVPEDFNISPIILRQWYIGDGTGFIGSQQSQVQLTSQLTEEDGQKMIDEFKNVGVQASQQVNGSLHIWKRSHTRFFEYMAELPDEIDECFGYKWRLAR